MKSNANRRAIIVGIFITIGLAILIILIFTLGGERKTFVKKFPLKTVFNDVGGLKGGDNVWFSGVKVGVVSKIQIKDNSQVEVILSVEKRVQHFIHKDASVKLSAEGLLGNKLIVIYGGTPASPMVDDNDYLKVVKTSSTEDMFATLQSNNTNLLDITNKINHGDGTIGLLINDKTMSNNLLQITRNLDDVSRKLSNGEGSLGSLINDKTMANSLKKTIAHFNAVSVNLEKFSQGLNNQESSINQLLKDTSLYPGLKASVNKLESVLDTARAFSANLKTFTGQLNNDSSVLGVLLKDKKVGSQVKNTIKNLESSSHKLDEDLEALQHNFLLRGFFRKKAKQDTTN